MNMIGEPLVQFLLWLVLLMLVSFLLGMTWSRIFSGKKYQLLVFPGVLVHEFSHALGCLISGAKIDEISLFSSKGSYVRHGKPRIPLIGSFIISFSPIAGGIAFLWAVSRPFGLSVSGLHLGTSSLIEGLINTVKNLIVFTMGNWDNWMFWIFIYIAISVVICLVPSKQDFKNSSLSALIVLIALFLISYFDIFGGVDALLIYLSETLAAGFFLGALAVVFSIPVFLIKKLI